jgi:hypothetical protein
MAAMKFIASNRATNIFWRQTTHNLTRTGHIEATVATYKKRCRAEAPMTMLEVDGM